jgi:hypothetical protein
MDFMRMGSLLLTLVVATASAAVEKRRTKAHDHNLDPHGNGFPFATSFFFHDDGEPTWFLLNLGPILAGGCVLILGSMIGFIIWLDGRDRKRERLADKEAKGL